MSRDRTTGKNRKGFSLVEIIAAVVIMGLLAALSGFGLAKMIEGYFLVKDNTEVAQKAQTALNRMVLEFSHIDEIMNTSGTSRLDYSTTYPTEQDSISSIYLNGSNIVFRRAGTSSTVTANLCDMVTGFSYRCLGPTGSTTVPCEDAKRIEVSLTLTGASGVPQQFSTRVAVSFLD